MMDISVRNRTSREHEMEASDPLQRGKQRVQWQLIKGRKDTKSLTEVGGGVLHPTRRH